MLQLPWSCWLPLPESVACVPELTFMEPLVSAENWVLSCECIWQHKCGTRTAEAACTALRCVSESVTFPCLWIQERTCLPVLAPKVLSAFRVQTNMGTQSWFYILQDANKNCVIDLIRSLKCLKIVLSLDMVGLCQQRHSSDLNGVSWNEEMTSHTTFALLIGLPVHEFCLKGAQNHFILERLSRLGACFMPWPHR